MYSPKIPPSDEKDLLPYLDDEMVKIAGAINDIQSGVTVILSSEPKRVFPGMVVLADGVGWNPGSGEGLYRRTSTNVWKYLG